MVTSDCFLYYVFVGLGCMYIVWVLMTKQYGNVILSLVLYKLQTNLQGGYYVCLPIIGHPLVHQVPTHGPFTSADRTGSFDRAFGL